MLHPIRGCLNQSSGTKRDPVLLRPDLEGVVTLGSLVSVNSVAVLTYCDLGRLNNIADMTRRFTVGLHFQQSTQASHMICAHCGPAYRF